MTALGAAHLSLVLMILVSAFCALQLRRGDLDATVRVVMAANLVATAAVWLRTDKPVEGHVFVILSTRHGLTEGDLLIGLPLALALWALAGLRHSGSVAARLKRK